MKENRLPKAIAAFFACVITVALFHSVAMLAVEPDSPAQLAAAAQTPKAAEPATASARMHLALAGAFGHHANAIR